MSKHESMVLTDSQKYFRNISGFANPVVHAFREERRSLIVINGKEVPLPTTKELTEKSRKRSIEMKQAGRNERVSRLSNEFTKLMPLMESRV